MKEKLKFEDILLILAIVLQDAGTFGFLPFNLFQIIIIFFLFYLLYDYFKHNRKLNISVKIIIMVFYMILITLMHTFDFESIKSIVYFILELSAFCLYWKKEKNIKKILKIIFISAFVLSIFQIIQYIGYLLNMPALYDYTIYGFSHPVSIIAKNSTFRASSLYSEPAHLCAILSGGLFISLKEKKYKSSVLILLANILTISLIVYVSMFAMLLLYMFLYQRKNKKRLYIFFGIITVLLSIIIFTPKINTIIFSKLSSITSASSTNTSDLTSFAIKSNFQIAIKKVGDGYILGTGMDSHRLYYFRYINYFYSDVLKYLNYTEASSLYIRVLSEFGIVGIISLLILIIIRTIEAIKNKNKELLFILLLFIVSTFRNGHYVFVLSLLSFTIMFLYDDFLTKKLLNTTKIKNLIETGFLNTIRFNAYYFGVKSIFKPKVFVSRKTKILSMKGKVLIGPNAKSVKIGYGTVGIFDNRYERTILQNEGTIIFNGNCVIGSGSRIVNMGELIFGKKFNISAKSNIICYKKITFGDDVLISWNCNIMDTDFHKICVDNKINNYDKQIEIGNHVWICSGTTILKGVNISDNIVVGANSLVTKNLMKSNSIYIGNDIIKCDINWLH